MSLYIRKAYKQIPNEYSMKKPLKLSVLLFLASLVLACGLPAVAATPVAPLAPTETAVPTATSVPQGLPVSFNGVSFVIPTGLAMGASG
jgi:hypothetical protein